MRHQRSGRLIDRLEFISRKMLERPRLLLLLVSVIILVVGLTVSQNYFPGRLGEINEGSTGGATIIMKITDHDDTPKKEILPNSITDITDPGYNRGIDVTDLTPHKNQITNNLDRLPRIQGEIDYR